MIISQNKRKHIFAIIAASSGNLVEWFDFYVYAFFAIYFAPIFFPKFNSTVQLLDTAAIFAVGFLIRPIGGWLFGYIADKYGRKRSLIASVLLMCTGSLIIACLPSYDQIGFWAPLSLLLARLLQGLSVGGEYGTTATYLSEIAPNYKKGFFVSFQAVTLIGGQLCAIFVALILEYTLSDAQLKTWGWRIPFVIGAMVAVLALWLRRELIETTSTAVRHTKEAGSIGALLKDHWRAFLIAFGCTAGGSLAFYTFTTYMQKYLVNSLHMPMKIATNIMTACLLFFMLIQPFIGSLSDYIGRRQNMILFSVLGILFTIPLLTFMQLTTNSFLISILISVALLIVSFYTSVGGLLKAELFPEKLRALGVGLAHATANAIFGGTAEFIALSCKALKHEYLFYWYVTFVLFITLFASFKLPKKSAYL